jgi:hypothetical protein
MTSMTLKTSAFSATSPISGTWTVSGAGTFSRIAAAGHSGPGPYGRLTSTAAASVLGPSFRAPAAGAGLGASATLSVWLKGTVGSVVSVGFRWSTGAAISESVVLASTSAWQQHLMTVTVPVDAISGQVKIARTSTLSSTYDHDFDDISITINPAAFPLTDYSVQESGGNLDASKLDGGIPQITATILDYKGSSRLMDDLVVLTDDLRGTIKGTVRGLTGSDAILTVQADSPMALLNTFRTVPPINASNFGAYVNALMSTLGLTARLPVSVDAGISGDVFPFVGFTGNVYDQLKSLCAARRYVMQMRGDTLYFHAARKDVLDENSRQNATYSLNSQQSAERVVINYQNYSAYGNFNAYPPEGSNPSELTPISVNAGEVVVQTYQISGTAASVSQPVAVDSITLGSTNQYAIVGNDGLPVPAAQWTAQGGKVTVRVLASDPSQIEVTVRGASNRVLAPYRLAESSGNNYSALYIQAQGYSKSPKSLTVYTGASPNATSEVVGVTVDNPYISTRADAFTAAPIIAAYYAGPVYTINDSASKLDNPTTGFSLGATVGNRLARADAKFIVTNTASTAAGVQYSAILDTTIGDFNTVWAGETFADFNAQWTGYTFGEMTPIPLRRT